MTVRLGTHVSATVTCEATNYLFITATIVSGNELILVTLLDSNWLVVVWITIILGRHVSLTASSDPATIQSYF